MSVNTSDPMIGRLIDGRYQVRSRIARGGMATVYLATDLRLERRVAVKIMHGHLADDSQFTLRFIQEARSAARLSHPNVVNVFDQGQDAESAYLVMEYLPGITLRDLLHDYGALTPEQTIDITEAVLSGLGAAHKAGIVHRDLKPENVLLADDGRIKIGDFGLARAVSANTATGAALLGTIAYLSPELVTRGIADTRSDIYAVGIMMYEMLTGEQPYKGEQPMQIAYQHANDSVPTPSSKNPRVPAELDELVLWATARDPEDRPRDARALLDQVQETESQLQTALPTSPTAAQRTMVLPSTAARSAAQDARVSHNAQNAQTQVLGQRPPAPVAAPPVSDRTAALTRSARRRRGRGWIGVVVIVLLVAAAGGAGWWFGIGPGANVGVADVSGLSPAAATSKLTAQGLTVSPTNGTAFSLTTPIGQVAGTSPKAGSVVAKGQPVQLLISQGAQPEPLPALVGIPESDARKLVHSEWTLKAVSRQFDSASPKGTVIQALDASGASLAKQATYPQKQPISLVVSAGAIPDVAGKSVSDATDALTKAGLVVDSTPVTQSDDTVAKGDVIGVVMKTAAGVAIVFHPHDSITLIESTGPPPVTIPTDLVGQSWATVKAALLKIGLVPSYNTLADISPNSFVVSKLSPGSGTTVPKGSSVKVNFQGF